MKLLVDAVAVGPGSAAVVIGNLLAGWATAAPQDEIMVLVSEPAAFALPSAAVARTVGGGSVPARVFSQSVGVRRACRGFGADALLCAVTTGALLGSPCPYGVIVYDLRHELRPGQFSVRRRLSRRLLYGWSFRQADGLFCISERTRQDLLARRPRLQSKTHVMLLGADHAEHWRAADREGPPYLLAFGHFANKNLDLALHSWQLFIAGRDEPVLRVCGLSPAARAAATTLIAELGIADTVELLPWLDDDAFEAVFAGAAGVLFPSDFEGFGLPALEAMRLGIPVVISRDPALLEVTGGHAVVAEQPSAESLAVAIERALSLSGAEIAAATAHARTFTWERAARTVRCALASAGA